jgi:hypothetical protein
MHQKLTGTSEHDDEHLQKLIMPKTCHAPACCIQICLASALLWLRFSVDQT